jgi:hypothetical protein
VGDGEGGVVTRPLATLTVAGAGVADYVSGAGLDRTLAPRPFLHPVRTLGGVPVTDREPADHRWHLGAGVAIQDVGGVNVWGGRTYVRGTGYTWLDDHGTVRHRRFRRLDADGFDADLDWLGPGDRLVLREERTAGAGPVPGGWRLSFGFLLRNPGSEPIELGSPATNGRTGAGYGGFFWRFPALTDGAARTPDAAGEDAVHGTHAAWLAVSGDVGGSPVTVLLAPADDVTAGDPWFVRLAGYPGAGLQLAPEKPLVVPPGGTVRRAVHAVVADGRPDPERLAAHLPR